MKRKAIEALPPLKPTKKGEYITTVQTLDNIIILNVYKAGQLSGRHAINTETGEYEQYVMPAGKWMKRSFVNLLEQDPYCYWCKEAEERARFDSKEQEQEVTERLKELETRVMSYPGIHILNLIEQIESWYRQEQREKAESNRVRRIRDKMDMVPPLPEGIREWTLSLLPEHNFIFYDKETGLWRCTECRTICKEEELGHADGRKKIRHNDRVICPGCGETLTAKKRTDCIEKKLRFMLFQRINDGLGVYRHFDVRIRWNWLGRQICLNEAIRILMNRISEKTFYCAEIFFNQYSPTDKWEDENPVFDDKRNPAQRGMFRKGFLYPEGIGETLEGTAYEAWSRVLSQMAAAGMELDYNRLLMMQNDKKLADMVELLFKGRFRRLLKEAVESISIYSGQYCGCLNMSGCSIEEVFKIGDRQMINRIRDSDGGERMVRWMRWAYTSKAKMPQEVIEWLDKNRIDTQDIPPLILERMSPCQVMHYVTRQQAEGYKGKTAEEVLEQWKDYLEMLATLEKKADDEMMYRPRELKRRHDECVEAINRLNIIRDMQEGGAFREEEAQRMRERFPGAEEILQEIREKYEYGNGSYLIKVPQSLLEIMLEGQALHHCVGATDRYFDRIMQRETYICFLRQAEFPEVPYYTIEVEPGGTIRQHRGMYDEETNIDPVKAFLREWQGELRKRLDRKDWAYAKESEAKRRANLEELRAQNNTRVLKGLLEDFMEAI